MILGHLWMNIGINFTSRWDIKWRNRGKWSNGILIELDSRSTRVTSKLKINVWHITSTWEKLIINFIILDTTIIPTPNRSNLKVKWLLNLIRSKNMIRRSRKFKKLKTSRKNMRKKWVLSGRVSEGKCKNLTKRIVWPFLGSRRRDRGR